jgi:ABC-2 type transport system permease protein
LLPPGIAACLRKEFLYLLRSGPKLYVLVMPIFMVLLFSMRTSGVSYFTGAQSTVGGMYFSYGCAYTMLIFVSLLYNSFGSDGSGVQFYFVAPLRIRDVVVAKNLLAAGVFSVEAAALYIATVAISHPAPLDLTVATLVWCAFTLLLNMAVGNIRSIVSPRVIDTARVRGQNVSGLNSLISLLVVVVTVLLGAGVLAACHALHISRWIAAAVFLILTIFAATVYWLVLEKTDAIAAGNVESLTRALGKI